MSTQTSNQSGRAAAATVTELHPQPRRSDASAGHVYDSIVDLAPNPDNPTPMVRLSGRINPHPDYEVLVKLEGMNPFGSIKDRTALYMLNGLQLDPGQALVEPSAGNTGIALAAMANARDLPIEIAVPDGTPEEKKALLRFLGAELIEVEDELCPLFPTEGARGVVKSMVESEAYGGRYVSPNQYENELNVEAHYRSTGPEIWRQTGGRIDTFIASIGKIAPSCRQGLRSDILFGGGDCRACRHTEPALDTIGELNIVQQFLLGLKKFPSRFVLFLLILPYQVRLHRTVLFEKTLQVRHKVPDDVVIGQRFDDNPIGMQVDDLVVAGKARQPVNEHAAGSAYSHAARRPP